MIRKNRNSITRTALYWTAEGKRKRGRPKNTWRRTVEGEMKTMNNTWRRTVEGEMKTMNDTLGTVKKMAKDRQKWKTFVAALHANGISGSK